MSDLRVPLIRRLQNFPPLLIASVEGVNESEARWQPRPGDWSIVQILGHLLDEECDDFRPRLFATLEEPGAPWAPIDPEEAVLQRDHQNAVIPDLLRSWERERRVSIDRLEQLGEIDWTKTHRHPQLGPLRAGDLLLSWVNHDQLHLRQIVKRLYQLALRDGSPYECAYAGPW